MSRITVVGKSLVRNYQHSTHNGSFITKLWDFVRFCMEENSSDMVGSWECTEH